MKTDDKTLITALRILAAEIQSGDGVANACIAEAADRLEELTAGTIEIRDCIGVVAMMSDPKTTTPNNHPCRLCGVGHHLKGKCDMCSVSTDAEEREHAKWLAKRKRERENSELWR